MMVKLMAKFNSLKDLQKSYSSAGVAMGLGNLQKQLQKAGEELKRIVEKNITKYYNSYTPVSPNYTRTYNLLSSVRLSPVERSGNKLQIRVYFDDALATHSSLWGGSDAYIPLILSEGFAWKNQPARPINHFTYFLGTDMLQASLDELSSTGEYPFTFKKVIK